MDALEVLSVGAHDNAAVHAFQVSYCYQTRADWYRLLLLMVLLVLQLGCHLQSGLSLCITGKIPRPDFKLC